MKQSLLLLAIMVSTALTVSAQKRKIDLCGHVYDQVTHHASRRHRQPGRPHLLGEVVVKGTRIKMAYKNDTIVYNASAFQLPDGSMLDALVRQMPGVELKDDGTILVNGEKVDFLTLNGRATITLNKMGQRQGYNTTTGAFTQMLDNVSRPS